MQDRLRPSIWPYLAILVSFAVVVTMAVQRWNSLVPQTPVASAPTISQPPQVLVVHDVCGLRRAPIRAERLLPVATTRRVSEAGSQKTARKASANAPVFVSHVVVEPKHAEDAGKEAREDKAKQVRKSGQEGGRKSGGESDGVGEAEDKAIAASSHSPWPVPTALVAELQRAQESPSAQECVKIVLNELHRLRESESLACDEAGAVLADLSDSAVRLDQFADQETDVVGQSRLRTAGFALQRRLDVWQAVHETSRRAAPDSHDSQSASISFAERLDAVDSLLADHRHGADWNRFLLLDELRSSASHQSGPADEARRNLARRVLTRAQSRELEANQRAFLQLPVLVSFFASLRPWAEQPVSDTDLACLMADLESYENAQSTSARRHLGGHLVRLGWSTDVYESRLLAQLDAHYRNANLRVAVTEEFINRLIPTLETLEEDVRDEILGARVSGRSATDTQLLVRLLPDPARLRLELQAEGVVASNTASRKGPVTLYSLGDSAYVASVPLLFGRSGLRIGASEAAADSRSCLTGVDSDFDAVPLIGSVVRELARSQHDAQRDEVRMEVSNRVASRASDRLDSEIGQRLADGRRQFRARLLEPLRQLQLEPVAMDARTTAQRVVLRSRLAGDHQLAAHTPRPRALSNSLISYQIHQTALNNVIEQLELDGRRSDLRQLYQAIGESLGATGDCVPDDVPRAISVHLADEQAVRVHCDDGLVTVTVSLRELSNRNRTWRNFTVRSHYRPHLEGLEAHLERDGTIELAGERLHFRDQIALRGIFTKVFSRSRRVPLIHPVLADHPNLADLNVVQHVIRDGWIGLAIGPKSARTAYVARGNEAQTDVK